MVPALISMISFIFSDMDEFVAILITGDIGFPVGVPNPVVKTIMFAPALASPVVLSTSPPGFGVPSFQTCHPWNLFLIYPY